MNIKIVIPTTKATFTLESNFFAQEEEEAIFNWLKTFELLTYQNALPSFGPQEK